MSQSQDSPLFITCIKKYLGRTYALLRTMSSEADLPRSQSRPFLELAQSLRKNSQDSSQIVRKISESVADGDLDHPEGLSILTVKVDALLAYIQNLALLCVHRLSGHSLGEETGSQYVKNLVKLRLRLEKMRPMEARLKYQVEKLLQTLTAVEREASSGAAHEDKQTDVEEDVDMLSFRPNPESLVSAQVGRSDVTDEETGEPSPAVGGVYRPPKVAPVVYDPDAHVSRNARKKERQVSRNTALLADLTAGMSTNPYETSVGGVGGDGAIGTSGSSRARALRRMQEFEEENYKRLALNKKEAKKRRRDEQDVALGGLGLSSHGGHRLSGGIEEEFGDLLRGSERDARRRARGDERDAYNALQKRAKRPTAMSQAKQHADTSDHLGASAASTHKFKKALRKHKQKSRV